MEKFYFVDKDYQNESLNNIARRLAEYNLAEIINNYEVYFSNNPPSDSKWQEIGKLSIRDDVHYTVRDLYIINDIFNYNVFFEKNTGTRISVPEELHGTFDCLVSLAAGDMIKNNPLDIGLIGENHYVIDISPTALQNVVLKFGVYKGNNTQFIKLDIFNEVAIDNFLSKCEGTRGFFVISNCFMYIINSLIYDVNLRLKMQNKLIEKLANDKIEWYVNINSADGIFYSCVKASDIINKKLDSRFEVFPWIKR
jgi:hypothetical protein